MFWSDFAFIHHMAQSKTDFKVLSCNDHGLDFCLRSSPYQSCLLLARLLMYVSYSRLCTFFRHVFLLKPLSTELVIVSNRWAKLFWEIYEVLPISIQLKLYLCQSLVSISLLQKIVSYVFIRAFNEFLHHLDAWRRCMPKKSSFSFVCYFQTSAEIFITI